MSEAILKALMQLFALIVDIDEAKELSEEEKSIIRAFLSRLLSSELVEKYMKVFDEYLHLYHGDRIARGSLKDKKRTSLTAVRILGICEKINEELEQKQKIYVIIQLIEYIAYGIEIQEKELAGDGSLGIQHPRRGVSEHPQVYRIFTGRDSAQRAGIADQQ